MLSARVQLVLLPVGAASALARASGHANGVDGRHTNFQPMHTAASHRSSDHGATALNKQSAIEWVDVILDLDRCADDADRPLVSQGATESTDGATVPDVLFTLQLERLTAGSSHVGGRHGAVVRCPRCERSACFIGGRRYAHSVRLIRHWSSTRDAEGESVQVLDVRPEWQNICVGSADHALPENAEFVWD
jgi:hypothetical protein